MSANVDAFSYVMALLALAVCAFVIWYEYFRDE